MLKTDTDNDEPGGISRHAPTMEAPPLLERYGPFD